MRKRNATELEAYLQGFEAGINCFYVQLEKGDFTGKVQEINKAYKSAFDELFFINSVVSTEEDQKGRKKISK